MVFHPKSHRKKSLSVLIACALGAGPTLTLAQEASESQAQLEEEEVIVTGVRASQARSIDLKRNARNVVDSIVAEDIGQLPDTTITDSLQRITGVQITREANEGTSLNVRGMPQVLSTLNGEQFLSPWTITAVGANYSDIPAGMISGADVYKSQSANLLAGGISGLIDLKTMRPLDLDEGVTAKLRLEASQGSLSDQELQSDGTYDNRDPDYNASIILGYNWDNRVGVTLSGFKSSTYNANYQVWDEMRLAFLDGVGGAPGDPKDLDGDGDLVNDWYIVPQEFGARSNFMEREREGWSSSIEWAISDAWKMRGDIFYTRMDQYDRGVKVGFNNRSSIFAYDEEGRYEIAEDDGEGNLVGTGEYGYGTPPEGVLTIDRYNSWEQTDLYNALQEGTIVGDGTTISYVDGNGVHQTRDVHTLQVAEVLAPDFQTTSINQINRTAALNTNLQFDYDNGDNWRASVRYVYAEAEKQFRNAQLQQGTPAWFWADTNVDEEGNVVGDGQKDKLNSYNVTVDYRGDVPKYFFDADLSDAAFLEMYQGFADGEDTTASLNVARADASYTFNSNVWQSVDFGVRYGERYAENGRFFYTTPTDRYSTWSDPRIPEDLRYQLRTGNEIWEKYPEWRRFNYAEEDVNLRDAGLYDNGFTREDTFAFSDFGPIEGFENGVSSLNPADWDNPLEFMNRLYPGTRTVFDPGYRFAVKEATSSIYGQINFDNSDGLFGIPFNGDLGLRVVETTREVERAVVPEVLDRYNSVGYDDWNKIAFVSTTETLDNSFTDVLPSANINFFPTDDVIIRFGAAKTVSRNDLINVGSTLTAWYQQCEKTDENGELIRVRDAAGNLRADTVSCIGGGNDQGNVNIDPWRATVYNSSAEWYFADNAILGMGLFLIDIESSVESYQEQRAVIDGDGIDRNRRANFWTTSNAEASDLWGLELGYKHPFTFLPSFLQYTGIEANYTYSKSESQDYDLEGEAFPLPSNSEHQANLILWYDYAGFNTRLAYNWRSEEYLGRVGLNTNDVPLSLGNWLEPTGYLDMSINYWLNDHFSFYFNGTNLTEQNRKSYAQWEDQFQSLYVQERRFSVGFTVSL